MALNEIDRKLSWIDESSLLNESFTDFMPTKRNGSLGAGGSKAKKYKEMIQVLNENMEMLQLENLQLKNDL